MKILHVDSGREWRGGQAQVRFLLEGLLHRGHEQVLAAPPGSPLLERADALGVMTVPIGVRGDLDVGAFLALVRTARRFRPSIVHAHTGHAHAAGVAAARLAGVPVRIVTRRSAVPGRRGRLSRAKYRSGVSRYIAISRHVADTLIASGVDPGRVSVVYSGIRIPEVTGQEIDRLRRDSRAALGVPESAPVLGLVGALTEEKGHDLALDVLSRLGADVRLVFLGDGPGRGRLESRAARLGLNDRTVFAGFQADPGKVRAAFDLVLAPSRHEGLGTSILEALASGIPVVASGAGGPAEILAGGRGGIIVSGESPERWAAVVNELIADPKERTRLGALGRERAADFAVDRMIEGTEEVYSSVLTGAPGGVSGRNPGEVGT